MSRQRESKTARKNSDAVGWKSPSEKEGAVPINLESSQKKEKPDNSKKIFHNPKKSEQGGSKTSKEHGQAKSSAFYLKFAKRGASKSKGQTDLIWKENTILGIPKKSMGQTECRDRSKESCRSKDFGKLLKKVTTTL